MFLVRFILPLLLAVAALAVLATPLTDRLVTHWFQSDVELRSQLIFQSVEERLGAQADHTPQDDRRLFDQIARDKRVLAVGLCSAQGQRLSASASWPAALACPPAAPEGTPSTIEQLGAQRILISRFPFGAGGRSFVVLHDLSFSAERAQQAQLYLLGFLALISLTAALMTFLTARLTLRGWIGQLRTALRNPQSHPAAQGLPEEFLPLVREVRQMLRDLKPSRYEFDNIRVDWAPATLKRLLEQELPGSEVMVVSNREPYIHNQINGVVTMQRPASGVVTALEPIVHACGGTWIAHGSGNADRQNVDARDHLAVPPERPEYTLRRIWLSEEEEQGYYYGLANEGLWPLCHITFVRPNFRESDWQAYQAVNRKFADAVIKEAKTDNPVILVQDYHFALLPRYVREALPNATIITFWHIPWPNPEVFSICPWREEILSGLLGSSVLGFHTQFHCNNFMDSVDRFLESHLDREESTVSAGDHTTLIRPYPISIAWPPEGLEKVPPASLCHSQVRRRFGLPADALIGVGVERFDYTKGIIDRFQAIAEMLRQHPQWRGKFVFIQAAAPTRSQLPAYQTIQTETEALVEAINAEFGHGDYKPILLAARHHEPEEVFELFRAANFCIVSSLHDGMNLVAKEFVASREDEGGALILSTFAGASKELLEALLVNPYDTRGMAEAMHQALLMPREEQAERMRLMREMVREHNVYHWAARILLDAAHLRKRAHIQSFIAQPSTTSLSNVLSLASPARRAVS